MSIWTPTVPVYTNRVIDLIRGNTATFVWSLGRNRVFPASSTAILEFRNTYGQLLDTWTGSVSGGDVTFEEAPAVAEALPAGTSWVLTVSYGGTVPRVQAEGTVIRSEAPFPDAPSNSDEFDGVHYEYSFGTPGFVVDPAWRILNGNPRVYDNSGSDLPNAVAAGSLLGGDFTIFDDVFMLYFAPLNADTVRFTYNTIPSGNGEAWIAICSNYDATNYAAVHHKQVSGTDTISIATGSGPVTVADRASANHDTAQENFTAEYNQASNTFSVYVGTNTTPLVSWEDSGNLVDHGEGERYVGLGFKSALLTPGVEVCDWFIADTP